MKYYSIKWSNFLIDKQFYLMNNINQRSNFLIDKQFYLMNDINQRSNFLIDKQLIYIINGACKIWTYTCNKASTCLANKPLYRLSNAPS